MTDITTHPTTNAGAVHLDPERLRALQLERRRWAGHHAYEEVPF